MTLARLLDTIRLTELEVAADIDRAKRKRADDDLCAMFLAGDDKLAEKIRADDLEKFSHNLSNSAEIQNTQLNLARLEQRLLYQNTYHNWRGAIVHRLDSLMERLKKPEDDRRSYLRIVPGDHSRPDTYEDGTPV
jgi:hypothetical protein